MTTHTIALICSSFFALLGYMLYILAMVHGKARPHRTTRFVLMVILFLTSFALYKSADFGPFVLSASLSFGTFFVFLMSLKYGVGGWKPFDIACLCIAILSIIFWKTTHDPTLVLASTIIAAFVGTVPTILKTYRSPNTEVWYFWGCHMVAAFFTLSTISIAIFRVSMYPLYTVFINLTVLLLSLRVHNVKPEEKKIV